MKDIRNYSLLAHNTFGIDAKCSRFLEYESVEEARQIVGLRQRQISHCSFWVVAAISC